MLMNVFIVKNDNVVKEMYNLPAHGMDSYFAGLCADNLHADPSALLQVEASKNQLRTYTDDDAKAYLDEVMTYFGHEVHKDRIV